MIGRVTFGYLISMMSSCLISWSLCASVLLSFTVVFGWCLGFSYVYVVQPFLVLILLCFVHNYAYCNT